MNWIKVSINTSEQAGDIISSVLVDAGAPGVQIEGGAVPQAKGDEYGEIKQQCSEFKVIAYYGENGFSDTLAFIKDRLDYVKKHSDIDFGSLTISINEIEDKDWNENFKKHFTTFRAAGNIVIKPTWEDYEASQDDIVIEMDPGMAFGSGVHETTKMCLELVQKYKPNKQDWSVMDVGCGSGILGIACAKLGAGKVTSLDYDNVSVDVTKENAHRNNVELTAVQSDLLQNAQSCKYDIVLANIIADIIIRLNKDVAGYMKGDSVYIVSGIIEDRLNDVLASLGENKFEVIETLAMADWRAIAVRKKNA